MDRHCQAFVACEVPEIWEDNTARESFEDSFFESLALASPPEKNPRGSAKQILDSLGLSDVKAEKIKTALQNALKERDWYRNNFEKTSATNPTEDGLNST
ncbi:MAG: hypothetical protein OXI87_05070 [Albidovulum sp.]|nr:hypothetical protein [Albidovulum sp.]